MSKEVLIFEHLPEEPIKNLRFIYIVIDSEGKIYYEFNNKGHIILPIHWSELNPFRIYKNLPQNLIARCISSKKNIAGVLQIWIYETNDYQYGRIRAIGILQQYQARGFSRKLIKASDALAKAYNLRFIEAETAVIPKEILSMLGFKAVPGKGFWHRFSHLLFRQVHYVKEYH